MLTVSTPAVSRALLTTAELRVAAGLASSDASRDTELAAIGLAVSDTITIWCDIADDGLNPATLLRETLVETFRTSHHRHPWHMGLWRVDGPVPLILARRFLGTVSVVEGGTTLVDADFSINAGSGLLTRLYDDRESHWPAVKIVVTYQAGFATIPRPLADVAAEMVGRRTGFLRDAMLKREKVETMGVELIEREYWVDAGVDVDITPDMAAKLDRYRTMTI